MAEDAKTYVFGNESQVPAWLAMNNGNGFLGGNGLAGGALGFLLGLVFGNGGFNWGNGGYGMNGGAAAASLGAQATANSNTELLMNAINGTDADIRQLATMANSDFDSMKTALATLNAGLTNVGSQIGISSLQVVNAIQSGNAALASQLCSCCCSMKELVTTQGFQNQLATLNQTNALNTTIAGGDQKIVDAIADLKSTTISEFCAARERDMQSKIDTQADIITQLRNQADNAAQTIQFNNAFSILNNKITELSNKTPNTVPVQWPQLTAINTSPSMGNYGWGFNPYGYNWNGSSYWA